MKKIFKQLKKFKYKHPQLSLVFILLFINLLLLLIFAFVIAKIENTRFVNAFVYVLTMACMPDVLFDFETLWSPSHFIQLCLMVLLAILFSGTIIGFVTNIFSDLFEKNSKSRGKIDFENHLVFLNWSKIAPNLIYDLSFSEEKYDIIILSDFDRDDVIDSIESIFILNHRKHPNLNIIVKEGNPFSIKNLEECSISQAKSISILTTDAKEGIDDFGGITDRGIYSLKLLMTVAPLTTSKTNIVVETDTELIVEKIKQLSKHANCLNDKHISVFSYDSVLGQLMSQILINPLYSKILYEVFSFEGCEFYAIPNTTIEAVLAEKNNCIPVVAYDDDRNGTIDQVYVLASEKSNVFSSKFSRTTKPVFPKNLKYRLKKEQEEIHILIIGSPEKADLIIKQIEDYNKLYGVKIDCYKEESDVNIVDAVSKLKEKTGIKKVLITSSEDTDENSVDANIYLSLLEIQAKGDLLKDIDIYTEILNPANYESTSNFNVNCVVISRKFISLMIVQLLTHPESLNFYTDLISVNNDENDGSFDICILKASEILEFNDKLVFDSKAELVNNFYYSSNKERLLIGLSNDGVNVNFLCDNLDAKETITITKDTQLVLINLS